jgi:hypothetical protein
MTSKDSPDRTGSMIRARRTRQVLALAAVCAVAYGAVPAYGQLLFGLADYTGEETYQRFCASCHGTGGEGDGPVAGTLNVAVPDLTRVMERRDSREFPAAEIREIIDGRSVVPAHGTRIMPVWGYEFWVEEGADIDAAAEARRVVDRLVRYLETIQVSEADRGFIP